MPYSFAADETAEEAFRRCAREQLETATNELTVEIDNDPVRAVHNARKAVKKERALLRLSRGSLPAKQRKRENKILRDAARTLSDARDADVLIQALDQLSSHFSGQLPDTTFREVRKPLVRARAAERRRLRRNSINGEATEGLKSVWSEIDSWKLKGDGWKSIEPGLMWSYRTGRDSFRKAQRDPTDENLHAWRKRVKDLWYQLRLLSDVGGPVVKGQAKEAHKLADLLGDDHDLGVLRESIVNMDDVVADVEGVLALLDHRRGQLQSEAFNLGQRLYAEKPGAFRRRMRRSWDAGRTGARDASEQQQPVEVARRTRRPVTA
ncbi:MAG: CHAD domain-containing protein [Solirubrobacterales bacterium]|nr:CHAD domain-containing protein [Solirubrobacterales bacterium]